MDEKLLLLINRQWTGPGLDRVMAAASSFDVWAPLGVVLILVLLWRGGFRMRAFIVTAAAIVGINDGLIARYMKRAVDRPRPHQAMYDVRIVELARAKPRLLALGKPAQVKMSTPNFFEDVQGRAFPSSHTMNMISLALCATAFFGRRGAWVFAIALLVSYSRIYTGSHWPSDVITSIFLGLGTTALMLAGAEFAWRRTGARWAPRIHSANPHLCSQ